MYVRNTRGYRDKYTGLIFRPGSVRKVDDDRGAVIVGAGFAVEISGGAAGASDGVEADSVDAEPDARARLAANLVKLGRVSLLDDDTVPGAEPHKAQDPGGGVSDGAVASGGAVEAAALPPKRGKKRKGA